VIRVIARRVALGALILWIVSVVVFAGTELLSGDTATAILGQTATPGALAAIREELNLDEPAPTRYAIWLADLARGDLGDSLASQRPVTELIGERLRNSFILTGLTAAILIPLSLLLGTLAAARRHGLLDNAISTTTLALISLPEFVIGMILVLLFAVLWPLLPAVSLLSPTDALTEQARALVLPVAALLAASMAHTVRMVRVSVVEALESDYVRMARLKGVPETRVLFVHALRNALVPSIQVFALVIGWLVGGIVVIEAVFQYPGIGQGLVNAVSARDLPVVQAIALVIAAVYVGVNLLADVLTILLTPRLRTAA
jgi:peptide/nickel transport system permease protein